MSDQQSQRSGEEVPEEEPKEILKQEQIAEGLSMIQRTHDGSSYAFSQLTLEEKEIQELGVLLRPYQHLQNINLSKNALIEINEVMHLQYLININAQGNQIADIKFFEEYSQSLEYLQKLDLSQNKIQALTDLPQPRLFKVNLSENEIASAANFTGHANLLSLNLSKNKLVNLAGIHNMARLTELNLSENEITSLSLMRNLPNLKTLNLNTNKIEVLDDLPDLPALQNLDLQNNLIEKDGELVKMIEFKKLDTLNWTGNPWADEKGDDFKKEVLIACDVLAIKNVNEDEVTKEDIEEAKTEKAERIHAAKEAAEEARLEAERIAAEKAEEEANAAAAGEEED